MRRLLIGLLVAGVWGGALRAQQPDVELQAAIRSETVARDLKKAITEYQAIAEKYAKTHRATAADALLRMAECYRKLGSQQATRVLERIVREFPDQKQAVAAASARLTSTEPTTRLLRRVWADGPIESTGTASGDGRYLPFAASDTGDLMVRDLTTGEDVRVTRNAADRAGMDFVTDSAISRDGSKIAYSWYIEGNENQLRLINRVADGQPSPRILLANREISYVAPFDWSPRGDWIAVQVKRADGTAQIGTVDAVTGTLRTLRSVDWRGTTRMSVSPDGAWIAYDLTSSEGSSNRDVFVISSDGSRQHSLATRPGYNVVVGWAPDARAVLFAAQRSGTMSLWSVGVQNGTPQGSPELVEADLGAFYASLGMSSSGRLTFTKKTSGVNVYRAAVDLTQGAVVTAPEQMTDGMIRNHLAVMWSPDGKSLAYLSNDRGVNTVTIQSLGAGPTRELTPRMSQFQIPDWSVNDFITFQGVDLKGRGGLFRMAVATGETSQLVANDGYLSWAVLTPDGKHLVYTRNKANVLTMVWRDLATGVERELYQGTATAKKVSPDGKLVVFRTGDMKSSAIMAVPISGGTPRELIRVAAPTFLEHFVEWLPDGRLLVGSTKQRQFDRLLAIGLDGHVSLELPSLLQPHRSLLRVHPDGQRVAFSTGEREFELWTLENFLPSASTPSARR